MSARWLVNFLLPGTLLFLAVGLCLGVALLYGSDRLRRLGRLWLLLLALFYAVGSTRAGTGLILAPLYRHIAFLGSPSEAQGATAVILLNAGANAYRARGQDYPGIGKASALRALEAARVYRLLGNPLVIVSGGFPREREGASLGAIISKALTDLGVPSNRIVVEPDSRDTREHAEKLKPYLEKHGIRKFVLVTSPFHMRRSILTFRAEGYDFVPSAAAADSDADAGIGPMLPTEGNLELLSWGMHEYLGLAYYWWNGWL